MSHYLIEAGGLRGDIMIPPSKSHTLRAILLAALAHGKSRIHHYLDSNDVYTMIEACQRFGAKFDISSHVMNIQGLGGKIRYADDVINAGNSGIVLRFCAAVGALASHPIVITGDTSIRYQRPMLPLLQGLQQLGVMATSMRGDHYAPIIIQGPLRSGKATLNGVDSQPISALLIAAAFAEGPIELHVQEPGEKPWIDMTLAWFDQLGIHYNNQNYTHYQLQGNSHYDGFEYTVPGDFSSAAFPLAAALVTQSELLLKNLNIQDVQGDKAFIFILQKMGAQIEINEQDKTVRVKKGPPLRGLKIDLNNCIDAITILAVISCFAEGETHIYNAAVAKQKECNRIHCIAKELHKMGAKINETEDGLIIKQSLLQGTEVESYHDHRMAMSLTIAALGAQGKTKINNVACVAKTFPTFAHDLQTLGAPIQEKL